MPFLSVAGGAVEAVDTATKFVGEMILGGIALLTIKIAYWAIQELKTAKNDHIEALVTSADRAERQNAAYQKTASATVRAIERLTATEKSQTRVMISLKDEIGQLRVVVGSQQSTLDSVVRDALRQRRSSGRYAAHQARRPPTEPPPPPRRRPITDPPPPSPGNVNV